MKIIKLLITGLGLILLSSCATIPRAPAIPGPSTHTIQPLPPQVIRQDIFHTVAPGESLWRISKIYDVGIDNIVRANQLREKDKLDMGQKLLIPMAMPACSIIPLYPSNKWEYIIIHHSATDAGNALAFYHSHKRRGFIEGLGYHFVIDNGTSGKSEGNIEVSPRWLKQQDGAHCKASGMNYKGIGICLVGNFSQENVSDKQMLSLAYLVNMLRKYYRVPVKNILGHGNVPQAQTECPGKKFPWEKFYRLLREKE
ncbi:MAG: N-acetylmuramoyl-L-alanine amidase [Candidatus Omnitrophota bacterium]